VPLLPKCAEAQQNEKKAKTQSLLHGFFIEWNS
jgi:hypothetical protein